MIRVLIIGGTGNISSSVSRLAVERGFSLTILNRGRREEIEGAEHIYADVSDRKSLESAIAGRTWDAVADFIAFNGDDARRDISAFSGKTGQMLFISSASCYAKPVTSLPITESTPLRNPYSPMRRERSRPSASSCGHSWKRASPSRSSGLPIHTRHACRSRWARAGSTRWWNA